MASDVYRYKIGDIAVTVLPDGFRMTPTDNYLANASKEELHAQLTLLLKAVEMQIVWSSNVRRAAAERRGPNASFQKA